MRDDAPDVEPLIQPLTKPPMYFGVDIIVFVVNGVFGIVVFIASSNFLAPLIVLPIMLFHQIQLFACTIIAQRYAREDAARPKDEPQAGTA